MTKKEIRKVNSKAVKKFLIKIASIGKKTWFFTIIFFVTAFGFSIWTWWQCILNPSPSEQIILDLQKNQKEFEMKEKRINSIIEKIQERKSLFDGAINHQIGRKIFKSKEEIFQEMNESYDSVDSSGVNRMP